jgi:hypothetical protein
LEKALGRDVKSDGDSINVPALFQACRTIALSSALAIPFDWQMFGHAMPLMRSASLAGYHGVLRRTSCMIDMKHTAASNTSVRT